MSSLATNKQQVRNEREKERIKEWHRSSSKQYVKGISLVNIIEIDSLFLSLIPSTHTYTFINVYVRACVPNVQQIFSWPDMLVGFS